ncbi:cytochrome c oxidase subunit VB-domain-containing protein [Kalaharituber pfeilii]|nr:cytochrome c oxidase subunit VB-domain-containing protein [Kalaharituber pfeilii]
MYHLQRTLIPAVRRAAATAAVPAAKRGLAVSAIRTRNHTPAPSSSETKLKTFSEIKTEADLLPPGAKPGTVPTDLEQATGLERLEILGKMEGVDIFDMRPLDASRKGTVQDPIVVQSFGEERYVGCTGYPADSHDTIWLTVSRDRPLERCPECGGVYKMDFIGPAEDPHAHDHDHGHGHDHPEPHKDPETFADYIKPEYRYM